MANVTYGTKRGVIWLKKQIERQIQCILPWRSREGESDVKRERSKKETFSCLGFIGPIVLVLKRARVCNVCFPKVNVGCRVSNLVAAISLAASKMSFGVIWMLYVLNTSIVRAQQDIN